MNIQINEQFFEQFLTSNGDTFFQIIKDKTGTILFPKNAHVLNMREEILSSKKDNENRYNLSDSNKLYSLTEKDLIFGDELLQVETFIDETENKQKQLELQIDHLTKMKNRQLTLESSKEYIEEALKEEKQFALIMVDIDYFKNINDTYGHDIGDKVLTELGNYFNNHTRQSKYRDVDIVGRIGGEEFLILLKDISLKDSIEKIKELQENFKKEVLINNIKVTISCGMCHFDASKNKKIVDVDQLLSGLMKKCDIALYYSKNNGRDLASLYDDTDIEDEKIMKKRIIPIKKKFTIK